MFENPSPSTAPVACDPSAIPASDRRRWFELAKQVYGAVQEVQELKDGYVCRLPGSAETLRDLSEYVSLDRQCCSFLRWTIRVEPEQGELWLALTRTPTAKRYLAQGFETTDLLPIAVAQGAGFDVSKRTAVESASVDQLARRLREAATSRD
jgi:hypothetical protein